MINKIVKILLIIFFAVEVEFSAHALNSQQAPDPLCGPKSLLRICEVMNVKSNLHKICELTGYDKYSGTTMLGLYTAARKLGLPAVPLKINIEQLASIKSPSIAFVDGSHFLVVHGFKGNNVVIQNPPSPLFYQPKEIFTSRWDGKILVFSETTKRMLEPQLANLTQPAGPRIKFNTQNHDFEAVNEGEKLTYTFSYTNLGSEILDLKARSSCTCTATLVSGNRISFGERGEIKIEFDTTGKQGVTKQSVYVITNDPTNKYVTLTITATVEQCVKTIPEKLWLDTISVGQKIERKIQIVHAQNKNFKIKSIETPEGIEAKVLLPDNSNNSIPLLLTIDSGNSAGKYNKKIVIHTNDIRQSDIIIPVDGYVLSDISATPPAFYFGEISSDTPAVRDVIVSPSQKHDLKSISVKSTIKGISFHVEPVDNGSKYKITAKLTPQDTMNTIKEDVAIYINDNKDHVLEIPLFAIIRKIN